MRAWLAVNLLCFSCSGTPPEQPKPEQPKPEQPKPEQPPAPAVREVVPEIVFRLPERQANTPAPAELTPERAALREILRGVVEGHARDPGNPWPDF